MSKCTHTRHWFSRTIEEDGSMHYYCNDCGKRDTEWSNVKECVCRDYPQGPMLCERHLQELYGMDGQESKAICGCPEHRIKKEEKNMNFETKDSGERQTFESGMVRDTSSNKIRYDLVDMPMLKRWAELMTRGAIKYGPNNWKLAGTQSELDRFKESAMRHFMTWFLDEDQSEDHGAAVYFNIAGAEMVKGKLNATR